MGKGRKGGERAERLRSLYGAGDHGAARRLAAELLADAAATDEERQVAGEIRARTTPDRAVAAAGTVGVLVAIGLTAWLLSR